MLVWEKLRGRRNFFEQVKREEIGKTLFPVKLSRYPVQAERKWISEQLGRLVNIRGYVMRGNRKLNEFRHDEIIIEVYMKRGRSRKACRNKSLERKWDKVPPTICLLFWCVFFNVCFSYLCYYSNFFRECVCVLVM